MWHSPSARRGRVGDARKGGRTCGRSSPQEMKLKMRTFAYTRTRGHVELHARFGICPFSPRFVQEWPVQAWAESLWRRMLGGGVVHAVTVAEAAGCSAKVPNLASKCAGSHPSPLCCVLACAGLEVNEEYPHAGSGTALCLGVRCCGFGAALSPVTPPRCWGSAQRAPGQQHLHRRARGCGLLRRDKQWNAARHGHFFLASLALHWCRG